MKIVAQIISEEVQMGVLNALRLVGTGTGSATSPVDVSAVLGEMLKVAAPQIVKKFLTDIDQQCQSRMNAMTSTLKVRYGSNLSFAIYYLDILLFQPID